ncbi:zinc finger protein 800a isoform X1 [Callorhinchus milii]|uniref:zinc finger protein 800a isoform X1 n=1 Tax=Callorhinchus milii TaxID=7868 RepID=UPI001C3FEE75|nr:zinc finger protein 800a isoform X1 [Callorhinchus milii]
MEDLPKFPAQSLVTMDRSSGALRKRHQHNSQPEGESEESKCQAQSQTAAPVTDKYCQTEHHHHGCCEPAYTQEPGDPPLLQQQLPTSKSGIQQIIECFRSGTMQLKHILLREVDTIFECKLCRSLFRGLPNLITHKEFYCFPSLKMDQNIAEAKDRPGQSLRELLDAIAPPRVDQEYTVKLEPILSNRNAVFQRVTRAQETELAATEPPGPGPGPEVPAGEQEATVVVEMEDEAGDEAPRLQEEVESEEAGPEQVAAVTAQHLLCCLCGKAFPSRRGVRRHVRKVHGKRMEELKGYNEERAAGEEARTEEEGGGGGQLASCLILTPGRSCPVCHKLFATKANVRRHFDEVHRGLRRDSITPDIATKPGQPLQLKLQAPGLQYSLATCRCLLCKRKYSSQLALRRHLIIVHKISPTPQPELKAKLEPGLTQVADTPTPSKLEPEACAAQSEPVASERKSGSKVKQESPKAAAVEATGPKARKPKGSAGLELKEEPGAGVRAKARKQKPGPELGVKARRLKLEPGSEVGSKARKQKAPEGREEAGGGGWRARRPKLSLGFDFKQLYCKLCKRRFTSRQNLTKHIALHTDGTGLYVKFFRCPLCPYETRRKRDVFRHVAVVHSKSPRYLARMSAALEARAVHRPIESVLERTGRRPRSPHNLKTPVTGTTEVRLTDTFSLHKCGKCGKAFARKSSLDQHSRAHAKGSAEATANNNTATSKVTRSRSQALLIDLSR